MQRSYMLQMGHGLLLVAWLIAGHDDVSAQTAGTAAPTTADQQAPQQSSSAPAPTATSAPKDSGIKVDPVQAAKTIYNIFGKKKKQPPPQPAAQTAPVSQAEIPASDPVVASPMPAQVQNSSTPKTVFPPQPTVKPIVNSPAVQPNKKSATPPSQSPVDQNIVQEPAQQSNVAPAISSAALKTPPTPVLVPADEIVTNSVPDWTLIAAFLALVALVMAGLKWFFFPKARLDLEFETGDSRLINVASPFVTLPDATFDVEFEWGFPSAPNFKFLQTGGQT
ncbi:MAG: hypothetical protein WA793_01175 [Sphingorhabdus sp.]|uniref:hypothetical protein n=1 Tax=Sphingorhabdus sp. TaxID=1902408 RepID=UPI003CB6587C